MRKALGVAAVALLAASLALPAATRPAGANQPTPWHPVPDSLFQPYPEPAATLTVFIPARLPSPRPDPEPTTAPHVVSVPGGVALHPRPTPSHRPAAPKRQQGSGHAIAGLATYYCCTAHYGNGDYAAAGPALRAALGGDPAFRGREVRVCAGGACVTVRLVDWCACTPKHAPRRLIDLEPAAFAAIAPLSRGIVPVTISW